jgi:serine/threonine protein kinase
MEEHPPQSDSQHLEALSFLSFEQESGGLPAVGADIGEYVLLSVLGRGATGVVFEAHQKSLDRRVALKLIPLAAADRTAAGKARMEREGRMLASMHHPNIIEVFDTGLTPDYRWLAMKLVRGPNLGQVLAGRADELPSPESPDWLSFILPVLEQISSAMASAHERGIVHRDIKPSNILLDENGVPHLVDFGLADSDAHIREAGSTGFIGTPLYASPEQARGEPLTAASDVFSFGAVAFEALNGRVPFKGSDTRELLRNIQFADPVWTNPRAIPHDVRAVIEKCLEKRIPDGYSGAAEVAEEFGRFLRFEPVQVVPRGTLSKWWQRTLRKPGRAAISASLAVLAAAAIVSGLVVLIQGSQLEEFRYKEQYELAAESWHRGLDSFQSRLKDLPRQDRLRLQGDALLLEAKHDEALRLYQSIELVPTSLADQLSIILASHPIDINRLPEIPKGAQAKTARDWLFLCFYHNQRGEYEQTLTAIHKANDIFPRSYPLLYLEGFALRGQGLTDEALSTFRGALNLQPKSVQSMRQLSRLLKSVNRFEECEKILFQARDIEPNNAVIWADIANLYMTQKGRSVDYVPALTRAAELDPDFMRPWVTSVRGLDLIKKKQLNQAEELLLRGLKARPGALHIITRLGLVHSKQKNWQEALEIGNELVAQPFRGWQSRGYSLRGKALFQLGRYDECIESFLMCTQLRPDMDSYTWMSARTALQDGKYDVLQSPLDIILETNPQQYHALLYSTQLRLKRKAEGDLEQAHNLAIRAVGVRPDSAEANYWLAVTLAEMGYPKLAMAKTEIALGLQPNDAELELLKALTTELRK